MSDLINIGASGIKAYSRALSTVGDNIANVQTPGFARRDIRLEETPPGGSIRFYNNDVRPGGVLIDGVTRAVDEWLTQDARTSNSDSGASAARSTWIEATERALDDGTGGVGSSITGIFNSADQLASNPTNPALRNNFLNSVDQGAAALRRTAMQLQSAQDGVAQQSATSIDQVNNDLNTLNRVNDGLRRARDGSTNQASLLDERDRLLDQVATQIGITTAFDAHGAVSVTSAAPGNDILLNGNTVGQFALTIAANGQVGFTLNPGGTIAPLGGALAGLSSASTHIIQQASKLDAIANQLASDLNSAHQAGFDANGNPGGVLLNPGTGAATITAIPLTASDVAAADGSSANGNILNFANLRGGGGAEAGWAGLVAAQSQMTAAARAQDAAASTRRDGAQAARDDVSAVDLDHEAAELLRFQQAYEASARVIQVARETMQTIFDII